jgi:Tripartite tricarboxylate transporter TctB family
VQLKNQKDFWSGLLFMVLGVCFAWAASTYSVGSAVHMGPGYFPLWLGALLTLLGGLIVFKALVFETEDGGRTGGWAWRPVGFIVLAHLVFGVLLGGLAVVGIPPMGLVLSMGALTLVAARASSRLRWKEAWVLALVLALGGYLMCTLWFQLPMAAWPAFFGA